MSDRLTKKQKAEEKEKAISRLREVLKPGDVVWCMLRGVPSRSGMSRVISLVVPRTGQDGRPDIWNISWLAAAATETRYYRKREGLRMGGCGMDMGFAAVYNLASALWPKGHTCSGRKTCRSNDHSNGDRNYRRHVHKDGGYALRSAWL